MSLRYFLAASLVSAMAALLGLISIEGRLVTGAGFDAADEIHQRSVMQLTASLIKANGLVLTTISNEVNSDSRWGKKALTLDQSTSRQWLTNACDSLKKRARLERCEVVAQSKQRRQNDGLEISKLNGRSVLSLRFPVKLFESVVATGVVGVAVESAIEAEVAQRTGATILLSDGAYRADGSGLNASQLKISKTSVGTIGRATVGKAQALMVVALGVILMSLYWLFRDWVSRGFGQVLGSLEQFSEGLKTGEVKQLPARQYRIRELTELSQHLARMTENVVGFRDLVSEKTRAEALGERAAQLAHDLKGPVAALEAAVEVGDFGSETNEALRSVAARIRSIIGSLDTRHLNELVEGEIAEVLVCALVEEVVAEKRLSHHRLGIEIEFSAGKEAFGELYARVNAQHLKRAISNILDNAIEASHPAAAITVHCVGRQNETCIEIRDDGPGFHQDALATIGERGASVGKTNGSGLGLWHAKRVCECSGGRLEIESRTTGSSVYLVLPRCKPPSWAFDFAVGVQAPAIVVVDDEDWVHRQFEKVASGVPVTHLKSSDEVIAWVTRNGQRAREAFYFFDQDLGGSWNGTELIEELGLEPRAVLVTGKFDDETVRGECKRLGIKLIPKRAISRLMFPKPKSKRGIS